jgi:hypothetical protein
VKNGVKIRAVPQTKLEEDETQKNEKKAAAL